ncbi:WD40 repeat 2 [Sarocladium implicatum]|nr:WD40 repeat 2 [Sarocladium implicatum]
MAAMSTSRRTTMGIEGLRMTLALRHQRNCARTEITAIGTSSSSSSSTTAAPAVFAVYRGASPSISWIDVFNLNSGAAISKISGSGAEFGPSTGSFSTQKQQRLATLRDWSAAIGKAGEEVRYATSVLVRDLTAGKTLLEIKNVERGPVVWSADGRMVAAVEEGGARVGVWDARTGERRGRVMGHNAEVTHTRFTPEGRLVTLSRDGVVRVTNIARGKTEARLVLPANGGVPQMLELSEDGRTVTIVLGSNVFTWVPEIGSIDSYDMDAKRKTEGWALCGGAHGRWVINRTEDGFDVMDLRSGEVVGEVRREEEEGVVYTAGAWVEGAGDDAVVVMGRMDGVVEVWDVKVKA